MNLCDRRPDPHLQTCVYALTFAHYFLGIIYSFNFLILIFLNSFIFFTLFINFIRHCFISKWALSLTTFYHIDLVIIAITKT